ncbi:hypothetical protein [Lysinibacillus sp. F5]|uniref:hypothetical protein n=1 Tax=Lysinibacillus sp. F5 TaxID=1700846 RepID=UPI0007387E7E|nr:hypothetical protein [Lysinibacillus sp. F5]KUF37458.1 hypothetical protein AK833_00790 [Lysinibacillus sp. F5]
MDFLDKWIYYIAKILLVIVAICLWVGFLWEPAWNVSGIFFSLMILVFSILIIFSCITYIVEFIGKLKKRPRQH